jgi:hypothetical protein
MKQYTVVIGIYNENTTEQISLKEIGIQAKDVYEAHKQALLKCVLIENQTVLRVIDPVNNVIKFDLLKGFIS